jgi:nucleotide-binding universal stress UspA family protein
MKKILVPTDFSKTASNAIDYAVEIAKITKARLILFNVYSIPVVPAEIPILMPVEEIKKDTLGSLKKIEEEIHRKHGTDLIIECDCRQGFPVEEINDFAEENKADLIVMGMEGTGYLTEKLIGSITTSLIKKAKCPVLAIDKLVRFREIKNIVLACDYTKTNKTVLAPLKELAQLLKSHVYILNVVPELESVAALTKAIEGIKLDHALENVVHTFHYSRHENITEGINDFVNEKKIDMVVMIPRAHSLFQNLFHESNTKRMAFHTKVPLLALHE